MMFACFQSTAQDIASTSAAAAVSADTAVSWYYKFTSQRARLYNGKEFIQYSPTLEGHPYFGDGELRKGSIIYDEMFFDNVNMQYDLVKDELVIQHFDVFFKLVLISQKVKEFHLDGHHYRRLVKDSINKLPVATGFYDFLHEGSIRLLVKRTKKIDEIITDKVIQRIAEKDFYYIIKDSVYHQIKTYKSLLSILKDKSKEIRQDLRKNRIKFRKNREAAILRAVTFYDTSKNK